MSGGVVEVRGAKELRSTMRRAGVRMQDFTVAHRKTANVIVHAAENRTPVGPGRNGHIASTTRAGATQTSAIIRVGNNTRFPYAGPIHWGWPARHIRANPWVSEAAQATEDRWVPLYFDQLEEIVKTIEGA